LASAAGGRQVSKFGLFGEFRLERFGRHIGHAPPIQQGGWLGLAAERNRRKLAGVISAPRLGPTHPARDHQVLGSAPSNGFIGQLRNTLLGGFFADMCMCFAGSYGYLPCSVGDIA